ncbi:Eco57I restriction-modification methylase domain-containing protein [Micromonospora sp. DT44]|uniref:Eco57I restriction-modification methylase domain-containing protein n=1 Tax=Micromonospora sp. DT44 TaxID=3393439 RepID=UPI003CFB61F0
MSATARNQVFTAVHTIGGLLPADMLVRIAEGRDVPGSKPADYRVVGARSVRDDAERHWEWLKSVWKDLRGNLPAAPEADTPADPTGRAVTQWLEPLLDAFGFGALTPIGATGITSDDGGKTFSISHRWQHVPIHLARWNAILDKRPAGGGVPPQSLVQECLNRSDAHLWGVLTNGRQLRLLRDSNALATAAYVEFDLEAIFDGELFSEFVLLYRLLHVSRFAVGEEAAPSTCWLEKWRAEAITSGVRALDHHREAVRSAIMTLGTGFLRHPANGELRRTLDVDEYHGALLRLVYRLIFLFVAEDRDALHPPDTSEETRDRYATYFSSARLRRQALRRRGTAHADLYQALRIVLDALGRLDGRPELGLSGLGGLYDDTDADKPLRGMSLANADLLAAVRFLCRVRDGGSGRWRPVDYRNMGAEELGSIYESLLESVPKHSAVDSTFELVDRAGNDRKKTGSYYTPSSLIETLLDSTLDPVIDDAQKRGEAKASAAGRPDAADSIVDELLSLTVCDPACGSGHFLVAAARRIAKRVASVRQRNPEPTVKAVQHALHEVIGRCLYGVDLNPMAVELAKVSLWLEALEPDRPLDFLDAHIKHGNGLIGATPALIRDGIPSKAFKPVEGDDPTWARLLEKRNETERQEHPVLFGLDQGMTLTNVTFADALRRIHDAAAGNLSDVRERAADYHDWAASSEYVHAKHVADAWCAAFVWHKAQDQPPAITHEVFGVLRDPAGPGAPQGIYDEITRLREAYTFFHWHLEFPDIFVVPDESDSRADLDPITGWSGGFSCVLGNPPWDKVDFEDKKYFSVVDPSIAAIAGTARRARIAAWAAEFPESGERYRAARRRVKSTFHFAGDSGAFPLCARGLTVKGVNSLQTDQLFTERFGAIVAPEGRFGGVIPTAIATGAGSQHLFSNLSSSGRVASLYDFENRKPVFVGVHSSYKFCLLSATGRGLTEPAARYAFFLEDPTDLDDADRVFALAPEEITLINPNTGTLPVFRSRRDADLTAAIYRRIPVLWSERGRGSNLWRLSFKRLFDMTDDSDLFRSREQLEAEGWELHGNVFVRGEERMLPLYEAKMVSYFNHRAADVVKSLTALNRQNQPRYLSVDDLRDPYRCGVSQNWVAEDGLISTQRNGADVSVPAVRRRLKDMGWEREWLCGWCDVTASTNERTAIPALIPLVAVGHTFPLMFPDVSSGLVAVLVAAQSSLVFDFVSRQKTSGVHMALMTWKQLPVPEPKVLEPHAPFILVRVLELVYTAYDMVPLARDLGDRGEPFCWDETRRTQIRAELDAYFFHLYGIKRDDVDYIMETFQTANGGLKHNEIAKYGSYRTKDLMLAEFDRMTAVGLSATSPLIDGQNYVSALRLPPGSGPRFKANPGIPTVS